MSGDRYSEGGAALRALVTDVGPCLAGAASARHAEILEAFEAFVSLTEDELGRERTARAAAEAEANRPREMVQGLKTIVWVAEADTGRYSFVSRYAEEALGYPVERWLEEPDFWASHVHPEDREYTAANRRRCLREGKDVEFEYRLVSVSGRFVWFRESIRLAHEEGQAAELRGQMWDITRRKKVEKELYAARRVLAEQLDDLRFLHEISTRLSPLMGLQPLIGEILEAVMGMQAAEMGLIRLYDAAVRELHVATSRGLPDEYLAQVARLRPGEMVCGTAVASGRPVVVEDTETDPLYASYLGLSRLGDYRAAYSTPLIARCGDVLGTIATHFQEPHRPSERQTRLVELYARQVADFVQVAGLMERSGVDWVAVELNGRNGGNGHTPRATLSAGDASHARP
jgi:PAS domain S-box-containing protein